VTCETPLFQQKALRLCTLSVEDLISSLKCHEIGLNEHERIKKPKFIALKSRGKSSKALKALESKEESTSEDSDEDPEIVQKMAIVTPRFSNNVNNINNQSIQRKTECHTTIYQNNPGYLHVTNIGATFKQKG